MSRNNGREARPKILPQFSFYERVGVTMMTLGVLEHRDDTNQRARQMIDDDRLAAAVAQVVVCLSRACPFVRSAGSISGIVGELAALDASRRFLEDKGFHV